MTQATGSAGAGTRQLNVALAGLGFMGSTHLKAWKHIPNARVMAVTDADAKRLTGDLTSVGGNFGGPGEKLDFSAIRAYRTLDELLADPEIDAVDICLPTDQHEKAAIAALRAGKHTMLEKPMALTDAGAAAVLAAAKESGRTLMVGQILRFLPPYLALRDAISTSGRVESAVFRRRCAAPTWNAWLTDPSKSGGGIFDLLIHDVDYCVSVWGMPDAVRAVGSEDLPRGVDVVHAELQYPGSGPVIVTGGWFHPTSYPFSMDFTVVTEKATFEWAAGGAELREYGEDGKATTRALTNDDPFVGELGYFTECVLQGKRPERCLPEQSAQSVVLLHKIIASRKENGRVISCKG
jgi:predicted dehydrogenase